MDIPEWKRELLERKQRLIKVSKVGRIDVVGGQQQLSSSSSTTKKLTESDNELQDDITAAAAVFHLGAGSYLRHHTNVNNLKVLNQTLKMVQRSENQGSDNESTDSQEELQYGPGIVNKLKSRYLSLTLREPKIKSRPSILRRATSLENILDDSIIEDTAEDPKIEKPKPAIIQNGRGRNRYSGKLNPESIKRARSVETLLRCEEVPQRLNRPKRIQPLMNETERPPADVVKSKLKIFESTANRKAKKPVGEVRVKIDQFKTIINQKPVLKPKPIVEPRVLKIVDPPVKCSVETPKPDEELITRPNISKITEIFEKTLHIDVCDSKIEEITIAVSEEGSLSPQSSVTTLSPTSYDFNPIEEPHYSSEDNEPPILMKHITKPTSPPPKPPQETHKSKPISRTAIENISNASTTTTYKFEISPVVTSHLPGYSNGVKKQPPPLPKAPPRTILPPKPKALEPLKINSENNLSSREIEKNLLNRVKTEQVKNELDNNSGLFCENLIVKSEMKVKNNSGTVPTLWEQKPWHQQQSNTMVFNFSNRKDVPDYIENDGIILRPKREKPKVRLFTF